MIQIFDLWIIPQICRGAWKGLNILHAKFNALGIIQNDAE